MKAINTKSCGTCKHISILRTPTGRPVRGEIGRCTVISSNDAIAENIKTFMRIALPVSCLWVVDKFSVHPHGVDPSDGADCGFWEPIG